MCLMLAASIKNSGRETVSDGPDGHSHRLNGNGGAPCQQCRGSTPSSLSAVTHSVARVCAVVAVRAPLAMCPLMTGFTHAGTTQTGGSTCISGSEPQAAWSCVWHPPHTHTRTTACIARLLQRPAAWDSLLEPSMLSVCPSRNLSAQLWPGFVTDPWTHTVCVALPRVHDREGF